ncbi:hypothetical protein BJV82DRAFT_597303 [Fennellomyces sp. T-0311]|nr:hypothetical protein BJV82DRAFT_597303 [Fennellomyces sp. T-0311]
MSESEEAYAAVKALRERCQVILQDCEKRDSIEGMYRYVHSLQAEMGFLDKLLEDPSRIKKEYIQSSNLSYLEAVHEAIEQANDIQQIMELKSVPVNDDVWMPKAALMRNQTVKVDLVAEHGLVWIKVIARNAKGLRFDMAGLEVEDEDSSDEEEEYDENFPTTIASEDAFNDLPIFKKARSYLRSAEAHQLHFKTPQVVFAFMRLQQEDVFVERILARLREMGVVVHVGATGLQGSYCATPAEITSSLNLDVSTVLALISEMSHQPCLPDQVDGEALQIQARREQIAPALPILRDIIKDKKLFMVQSAYDRLEQIVKVVGGQNEQTRFEQLFHDDNYDTRLWTMLPKLHIEVLPDNASERFRRLLEPPKKKNALNNGRKIRSRFSEFHAVIFGSGDAYRMTTVTAIQWIQQAITDAGLTDRAIVSHEPRSLAEQKMHV